MEGATLVEKTKWRLNRQKTLKEWAVEAVQTNLHALTQIQGGNSVQNKLSPQLRDEVLQKLLMSRRLENIHDTEEFPSLVQPSFALMNSRTKKLDLDVLLAFYPKNSDTTNLFIEVLKMMSIAAPNVRHLKINKHHITICMDNNESRNACLECLSSLKELRILEFVGHFNNRLDFALLCRKLPNLRVLSAPDTYLENTNMSKKDIRLSFGHLRLLHIPFLSKKIKKMWKVLPNLDILGYMKLNGLTLEHFHEDKRLPRERKYLNFGDHPHKSKICADFTSIRYLEFSCDEKRWDKLNKTLKLPNTLDGLILTILDSKETVEAVLLKYGANLRWLSLRESGNQSVDLNRVSKLCPKLEILSLTSVQVTENAIKQANFSHLEELFTERADIMSGSLTALLSSCPNLRKLELKVDSCCLDDLRQVNNLIIEKKILCSLQSLTCGIYWTTSESVFKEISAIMESASVSLPDLRKMKINFDSVRSSIDKIRYKRLPWLYCLGLDEDAINDVISLFEILNLYE